jgi:hypothetical protein
MQVRYYGIGLERKWKNKTKRRRRYTKTIAGGGITPNVVITGYSQIN